MFPWPVVALLLLQTNTAPAGRSARCTALSKDYAPYAAAWLESSLGQPGFPSPLKRPVKMDNEKLKVVARMRLKARCDQPKVSPKLLKQMGEMLSYERCLKPPGNCKDNPELALAAGWFERTWRGMLSDKKFWRVQVDCKRVSKTLNEAIILATWPQAVDFTPTLSSGAKPVVLRKVKNLCEADLRTWKRVDALICCTAVNDSARCEDECHLDTERYEPGATTALQQYLGVGATPPPSSDDDEAPPEAL